MTIQKHTTIVYLQNTTESAEKVGSIDDLLTQILLKLPIKLLIRFKLVSKHFFSLITSHEFCLMHNPTPNPARGIFLRIEQDNHYQYDYIPLHPYQSVQPPFNFDFITNSSYCLHSCNGLLLCVTYDGTTIDSFLYDNIDRSMYVYNPTTNLSTMLPDLNWDRQGATLVFDPVKSPHYKVVMVVRIDSTQGHEHWVYIYSSETGGWSSPSEIRMDGLGKYEFRNGVYWNGSVHWLIRELSAWNSQLSLRFHVDTGMIKEIPSPPVVCDDYIFSFGRDYYFGESYDHLHFVEPILPKFSVYEMKRDYSEWFVKYSVDLSVFIGDHPEVIKKGRFDSLSYYVVYALSLVRGENDEESKLVLGIPGKAVKVNLVDGTSEKLCDITHNNIHGTFGYFVGESALDYIQSLCGV